MKIKIKALISALILITFSIVISANAEVYIAYYDENGRLIKAKTLTRSDSPEDIYEYVNFYAPPGSACGKIYNCENGTWQSAELEITEEKDKLSYTGKAPNVTDNMCRPQYWIGGSDYELIMSTREIKELNSRILANKNTMMNDLENLPAVYNGKAFSESLSGFVSPKGMYLNGEPAEESYYEAIRKNIRDAALSETETVLYGICTSRAVMKAYPYEDWLSDSSWDKEWDNFVSAAVLVGEPLVMYNMTSDKKFIYAKSVCCEGWIETKDVALCRDKAEWLAAKTHNNFLVITGERVWLEPSCDGDLSKKQLTMGTVLELADNSPFEETNRLAWNNYTVKLPVRKSDGSYGEKTALISANRDVNIGYIPYTRANVINQAFKSLGNRFGWGGMLDSQDCSSFVREVYLCFGIVIPRNTTWQAAMPVNIKNISKMTDEEKKAELENTPPGSILFFPGHEMMYLGSENDLYYTISNVSSLVSPENPDGGIIRPRSIIINDLSSLRGNGSTWLSNLNAIAVIE